MKKIFLFMFILLFFSVNAFAIEQGCCEKTLAGAYCQNGPAECDTNGGLRVSSNDCSSTTYCKIGYCFDSSEGICSSQSPQEKCIQEGGEWSLTENANLCEKGCCNLRKRKEFITETRCEILSRRAGLELTFDFSISEEDCRYLSDEEGACIYDEDKCIFSAEKICVERYQGEFYKSSFCSDINSTLYKKHDSSGCVEGKKDVYWFDSQNNPEEIKENCNLNEEVCAEKSSGAYCKNLGCIDENNKKRKNGESWCVYDGYVGESKDTVGSEHCKFICNNGEIELDECSNYRGQICAEKINPITNQSVAQLRDNLGFECFYLNDREKCEENPDCRIQSVNVDTYFKFDACVPKYPGGFDLSSKDSSKNGEDICRLASLSCDVIWDKDSFLRGDDDCKENCECDTSKFTEQMNNLCVSLGDCGGYVNYVNIRTGNFASAGLPSICDSLEKIDSIFIKSIYQKICEQKIQSLENLYNFLDNLNIIGENTPKYWKAIYTESKSIPENLKKINSVSASDFEDKIYGEDFDREDREVKFECKPWEAPVGGEDCSKCNNNSLVPCTDYRCESLGSTCKILEETRNEENPICVDIFPNNLDSPIISMKEVSSGYKYSKGENRAEIKNSNGDCPKKYSSINFTIETNEISKCIFVANTSNVAFELENEHSYNTIHKTNLILSDNERVRTFIICQDPAGNYNYNEYVVDICVSPEEDVWEPMIKKFVPEARSYLKINETNKVVELFLDEPADCQYSLSPNIKYEEMDFSMNCNKNQGDTFEFKCNAQITNLIQEENKIYFKCNDTSGNINIEDKGYILLQTPKELKIDSVNPHGKIEKSNFEFEVKTSGGMANGVSVCEYEVINIPGFWSDFFETNSTTHKQGFTSFPEGQHQIKIICKDKAGNVAEKIVELNVEIDSEAPIVVRAYKDNEKLKIITNEKSTCVYSIDSCSYIFSEGGDMTTATSTIHSVDWIAGQTYYIRCMDLWENINSGCAIKISPGF